MNTIAIDDNDDDDDNNHLPPNVFLVSKLHQCNFSLYIFHFWLWFITTMIMKIILILIMIKMIMSATGGLLLMYLADLANLAKTVFSWMHQVNSEALTKLREQNFKILKGKNHHLSTAPAPKITFFLLQKFCSSAELAPHPLLTLL